MHLDIFPGDIAFNCIFFCWVGDSDRSPASYEVQARSNFTVIKMHPAQGHYELFF